MFGPLLTRSAAHPALCAASRQAFLALQAHAGDADAALRNWGMVHGLAHLLLDQALPEAGEVEALIERLIR